MPVSNNVSSDGKSVTITVSGRFDFNDHSAFREAYRTTDSAATFTLDMSNTDYMDSSALGMLLLLREHAGGDNSKIKIAGSKAEIKKILTIANFQKLFEIK